MSFKNFIDHVTIKIKPGDGGPGSVHFRRERFIPKGGPDGGNGGDGGSIIVKADSNLTTLLHLKYQKHIKAPDGTSGEKGNKNGDKGENKIIKVPLGTIIKDFESSKIITEILKDKEEFILAKGGKGGLGNTFFKSSTNQSPRYAQKGIAGIEKLVTFELKILADVGLVGLPNSGKSSLLRSLTSSKAKIGNYKFTTLEPNLGVMNYHNNNVVIADVPGIIKNASKGKGLGLQFLKHIERNNILIFVIDPLDQNIIDTYTLLVNEIKNYNLDLLLKQKLIVISKSDLLDAEQIDQITKLCLSSINVEVLFISNITRHGIDKLKQKLWNFVKLT